MNHQLRSTDFFKIGFVFLFMVQALLASGTVKGRVLDKTSRDGLAAANILVKGTNIGTASDLDGTYIIYHVPAGPQILEVTYIGYESMEVEVTVVEDGVVIKDLMLEPVTVKGEAVVVTGQAAGQAAAINQQIASNTITNVVSKARINELPDDNAATALSRLPGISLQDGDKVVIRGIQAKLNTVLLNGIQIPSTELKDRSTNLGFISSNLLSGIEVIKALTPDMDANAIGGVVNLKLREAPTGFHFDLFAQGSYNTLDRVSDNYKYWASVSKRFFGDKLGIFVQGNTDRSDQGQDLASSNFIINGVGTLAYGEAPYMMEYYTLEDQWNIITNSGGSVILDYLLPKGKVVIQNTYAHNLGDLTSFRNRYNLSTATGYYEITRNEFDKDLLINALQAEYDFTKIKAVLSISRSLTDKNTDNRYGDIGSNMRFFNNADPHTYGYNPDGSKKIYLNEMPYLTLDEVLDFEIDSSDAMEAEVRDWVMARDEAFEQSVYNYTLDFTAPLTFSNYFSSKIKFGGKYTKSRRSNEVTVFFTASDNEDYYYGIRDFFPDHPGLGTANPTKFSDVWDDHYTRGKYYLDGEVPFLYAYDRDLFDRYMDASIAAWESAVHMPYSEREDFKGTEEFSAGYLMGDFNIGARLSLLGGVRFEHYNMNYDAKFVYCTHSVYGYGTVFDTLNTVNRNDDNIFPNLQVRYNVTDWANVRFAYSKGVARPDYTAILPSIYCEPGGAASCGNPKLKPAISNNLDLYASFYNNEIGLFSIGGFYKQIDNVFFETNIFAQNISHYNSAFPDSLTWTKLGVKANAMPTAGQRITTYLNNPKPAYLHGIETEWQTNFWYLPKPFNHLVFNINYTRTWSEMDYQQVVNIDSSYKVGRFVFHKYKSVDTVRTARLLYQGDHNLNLSLGIDYKGFSGRISYNLQGNVITSVGSRPEEDAFTGDIHRWDFTLQQKIPFLKGLSVAFNGTNIFNTPVYTYQKFRREVDSKILTNKKSIAYSPRTFQLNIRYNF